MKHKITPRQLVALVAAYWNRHPNETPGGVYGEAHPDAGKPHWNSATNMGGATARMVDDLRERGFLTTYNRYEAFGDKSGSNLTAKGFEALIERLDDLPVIRDIYGKVIYRFEIAREEIDAKLVARIEREADMTRQREEARRAERERANAAAERAKAEKIVKLRELFGREALADNWSDDKLLDFADRVASI